MLIVSRAALQTTRCWQAFRTPTTVLMLSTPTASYRLQVTHLTAVMSSLIIATQPTMTYHSSRLLRLLLIRPHRRNSVYNMRPIATDGVAWSVGLLVTFVSPAKTAETIEGLTHAGPGTMYLMGRNPHGRGSFWGSSGPLGSIVSHYCVYWSKKINNGISCGVRSK